MYSRGYRPDPSGHQKAPFGRFLAMRGIAPDTVTPSTYLDILDAIPEPLDQNGSSACVGHSLAAGIYTRCNIMADKLPWMPSPKGIYDIARARVRAASGQGFAPLTDDGTEPFRAIEGVSMEGIRPMRGPTSDGRNSDCEPATINDEPSLIDLEEDSRLLVMGAYAIESWGAQREQDIRVSLFHGFPLPVAVDASENSPIQNYDGTKLIEDMGTNLDHYVLAVSYRMINGELTLGLLNSCGRGYGQNGLFWIGAKAIQQLGDIRCLDIRKIVVNA